MAVTGCLDLMGDGGRDSCCVGQPARAFAPKLPVRDRKVGVEPDRLPEQHHQHGFRNGQPDQTDHVEGKAVTFLEKNATTMPSPSQEMAATMSHIEYRLLADPGQQDQCNQGYDKDDAGEVARQR